MLHRRQRVAGRDASRCGRNLGRFAFRGFALIARSSSQRVGRPRRALGKVSRVVVKVGSAVIAGNGRLRPRIIARIAHDVAVLRAQGCEVVMVVSGAVAAGYRALGLSQPPEATVPRQAAASVGQHRLMSHFARAFRSHDAHVAQILLSADDLENRRRFLSARHTMHLLIESGVVPIINENDALSDDEIKVGDNDTLAAMVTSVATADLLVILSCVPGVLDKGSGRVIERVEVGSSIDDHIRRDTSATGVGGMGAKVAAARLASHWSVPTIIADGVAAGALPRIVAGEPLGTMFVPRDRKLPSRKRWIAVCSKSRGRVRVDSGARRAIESGGASLLPAGVVAVEGEFAKGARVDLFDGDAPQPFAVGIVSYAADEIRRIQGRRPGEIRAALGYVYVDEVIHRDDLVLLD
ncbi:MAG: glutamate 5-kinase [Planctomycetota bacterium]|nr:MAG: glutamate 5-kinase [Planctomycetota bacterium]